MVITHLVIHRLLDRRLGRSGVAGEHATDGIAQQDAARDAHCRLRGARHEAAACRSAAAPGTGALPSISLLTIFLRGLAKGRRLRAMDHRARRLGLVAPEQPPEEPASLLGLRLMLQLLDMVLRGVQRLFLNDHRLGQVLSRAGITGDQVTD